jgi:hypothetical protein
MYADDEARQLRDGLRRMLDRLESGELTASAATRHRIEGAVVALSVVLGESSAEALGLKGL